MHFFIARKVPPAKMAKFLLQKKRDHWWQTMDRPALGKSFEIANLCDKNDSKAYFC